MKNLCFMIMFFFAHTVLHAESCTIENKYVKASIAKDGTFGAGVNKNGKVITDPVGIIFDKSGKKSFKLNNDYLNSAGIPYEFFSIKIGNDVYANDNSDNYKNLSKSGYRKNTNKLNSRIVCNSSDNEVKVESKIPDKLEIIHKFKLYKKSISITVEIKNISENKLSSVKYARGIDVDPGEVNTRNKRGVNGLKDKDIVYTVGETKGLPLAIYSNDTIQHNVSVLDFNNGNGCIYDPSIILSGEMQTSDGDGVIYIAFDLGNLQPQESKKFTFYYIMGDNVDDIKKTIFQSKVKVLNERIKIPYTNSKYYKLVGESSLSIVSDKNTPLKDRTKEYNATFTASGIPEGMLLRIDDNNLTKGSSKTKNPIYIKPNRKGEYELKIKVFRNKNFKKDGKFSIFIKIAVDKKYKISFKNDKVEFKFEPESRKLKLLISPSSFRVPLNKLDDLDYIEVKVKDEMGDNLTKEELKKIDLKLEMEGVNYKFEKDPDTLQYKIYVKSETPLCLTKVGNIKGKIIIDEGFFPNDYGEAKILGLIEDISWWEKCKNTIYTVLAILFTIWYILGMIKKPRFNKKKYLVVERYDLSGNLLNTRRYGFKKTPFYQKIIPYVAEKISISGLKFIASNSNKIIIKRCNNTMEINGLRVEVTGDYKNCMIFTGTKITKTSVAGRIVITYN